MGSRDRAKTRRQPLFMQQRSTDEYAPRAYAPIDERVVRDTTAGLTDASESTGVPAPVLAGDRLGTAIGLRALNEEWGADFYEVPEIATRDRTAAEDLFSGPEVVIDVQTHLLAPGTAPRHVDRLKEMYRNVMPDWWSELDPVVAYTTAEFIRDVFLRTENAVAVLTTGPGHSGEERPTGLFNHEMAAMRALVDGTAGSGRLLNHAVVHASVAGEIEAMEQIRDDYDPVGWKVYTTGTQGTGLTDGWQLDDERYGLPFLEQARRLGVGLVCAHKGLSNFVDNGSPRDVGPAAAAFPDLDFVIYHSGYEFPPGVFPAREADEENLSGEEGPYSEELAHLGVNRLLASVADAGLGSGRNVHAELGTTWFCLIRRPREAAHVLGKLIAHLGEDNVIWGTDSIWYGSAQPLIDAFRVFQIPDDMCERYGYSKLTPAVKAKILGRNAACLYGIDLGRVRASAEADDLSWSRELVRRLEKDPFGGVLR